MTRSPAAHSSVRHIRRRLFLLLMQAFGAVVLLTAVLLIVLLGLLVAVAVRGSNGPQFTPQVADLAQAYYLGRGSWEGVDAILTPESVFFRNPEMWSDTLLVDAAGRVLIDGGQPVTDRLYTVDERDIRFPIIVRDATVGHLVLRGQFLSAPTFAWGLLQTVLAPVTVISFFTGLLTLLIGFLLARRVVTPLADVIAAAHGVAEGDLSARVQVRGPGDLKSLSDSFNRMAEALERNDRERRNWLADIAHELRTPLTVMRGKLEGIVDGVYAADETHIAPVLSQTYVLERLVEDLRLLTLAEMRQLHFDSKPVALAALAEQAVGLFEAEAAERGIALTLAAEANLPTVTADPQRVGQVIGNVLSNALRYVPEGGAVQIEVRAIQDGVEVAVSDNGPGVPEADLPHLFDRFWRGDKSRARAAGGAGLGLAIARQLIEAQGGHMTARNRAEAGLCVAFVLK